MFLIRIFVSILAIIVSTYATKEKKLFRKICVEIEKGNTPKVISSLLQLDLSKVPDREFCQHFPLLISALQSSKELDPKEKAKKLFEIAVERSLKCSLACKYEFSSLIQLLADTRDSASEKEREGAISRFKQRANVAQDQMESVEKLLLKNVEVVSWNVAYDIIDEFFRFISKDDFVSMRKCLLQLEKVEATDRQIEHVLEPFMQKVFQRGQEDDYHNVSLFFRMKPKFHKSPWITAFVAYYEKDYLLGYKTLAKMIHRDYCEFDAPNARVLISTFLFEALQVVSDEEVIAIIEEYTSLYWEGDFAPMIRPILKYALTDTTRHISNAKLVVQEFVKKVGYETCRPYFDRFKLGLLDSILNSEESKDKRKANEHGLDYKLNIPKVGVVEEQLLVLQNIKKATDTMLGIYTENILTYTLLHQDIRLLKSYYEATRRMASTYKEQYFILEALYNAITVNHFENEPLLFVRFHVNVPKCRNIKKLHETFKNQDVQIVQLFLLYYCNSPQFNVKYEAYLKTHSDIAFVKFFKYFHDGLERDKFDVASFPQTGVFPSFYSSFLALEKGDEPLYPLDFELLFAKYPNSLIIVYYWALNTIRRGERVHANEVEHAYKVLELSKSKYTALGYEALKIAEAIVSQDKSNAYTENLYALLPFELVEDTPMHDSFLVYLIANGKKELVLSEIQKEEDLRLFSHTLGQKREWIEGNLTQFKFKSIEFRKLMQMYFPTIYHSNTNKPVLESRYYNIDGTKLSSKKVEKSEQLVEETEEIANTPQVEEKPLIVKVHKSEKENPLLMDFIARERNLFNLSYLKNGKPIVSSKSDLYRFRKGDYRAIYFTRKEGDNFVLIFIAMVDRGSVYDNLPRYDRRARGLDSYIEK